MPTTVKRWRLLPHDSQAVDRLSRELSVPPVVAQLLLNRGVTDVPSARRFLDGALTGLLPPEALPGVEAAAALLLQSVREGKRICIYGDYDVDGVSGTALLRQTLLAAGAAVDFHVPNRLEEGYGLRADALSEIAGRGTAVVVTVDCGIASLAEAEAARRLGLTLIVTDHHEMKATLPDAAVLVHPRLPGTAYPFGKLSGSAVAWKLAWRFAVQFCGSEKVSPRFREVLLDGIGLAALGVVADVVPLWDENRILVKHGLVRLQQKPSLGLRALMEVAGLEAGGRLRASDIGYKLAPRLNAAGRLGCARLVVELLTTTDQGQATQLARFLEDQNVQRQTLEREMVRGAREQAERLPLEATPALVLASADWHPGVIGIVASRLVEQYARPVLMIALRQGENGEVPGVASGSGRSIPGFALHEALAACGDLLLSHGGHHQAAGFKLSVDRIDAFRERFCAHAAGQFPDGLPTPILEMDAEVPLSILTTRLVRDLDRLEPYGSENREPRFLAGDLVVEDEPRKVGRGELHLSFRVRQGQTVLKAIAFGMADRLDELMSQGGACSLVFRPKINVWKERESVDLFVEDFQAGPSARLI